MKFLSTLPLWIALVACDESGTLQFEPLEDGSLPQPDMALATADPDAATGAVFDAAEAPPLIPLDAEVPPDAALPDAAPPVCPELDVQRRPWRRPFTKETSAAAGAPHHSAVDPVVIDGQAPSLDGKFAYGITSRDLEGETVVAWARQYPCGEWFEVGDGVTDDDGRLSIELEPLELGVWDFSMVVPGDLSHASGRIFVVEAGQQMVVFDIDGTLTVGDSEIFQEILLGSTPQMYPAADDVVHAWADAGYLVHFITGRPYFLNRITRDWLRDLDFPIGPMRTTNSIGEFLPSASGVQAYKRDWLNTLQRDAQVEIVRAYGNANTDVCAYAQAGVAPSDTYIIGEFGGTACEGGLPTQAISDYPTHLPTLADLELAR